MDRQQTLATRTTGLHYLPTGKPDAGCLRHIHQSPFVKDGSWVRLPDDTWYSTPAGHSGRRLSFSAVENRRGRLDVGDGAQSVRFDAPLVRPRPRCASCREWFDAVAAQ